MPTQLRALLCSALIGTALASTLSFTACRGFRYTPDCIVIIGDDDVEVRAITLEEALESALKAKQSAADRGDALAVADWQKIIEQILKKKAEKLDAKTLLAEADETGTVSESTDEKGATIYDWLPDESGVGAAGQ